MDEQKLLHLSQINTAWSLVMEAYQGTPESVTAARQRLLQRYSGAIYRYLLGILHDVHVADDLTRRFGVRFLQGDLPKAAVGRVRFRDAVQATLIELYNAYHQQQRPTPPTPTDLRKTPAGSGAFVDLDQEFLERWREEFLNRAWEELSRCQEQTGRPLYTMLSLRYKYPKLRSAELAAHLSARLGKAWTETDVRYLSREAGAKFADLLLDEVILSLEQPTLAEVREELLDLRLLDYCRTAFDQYRQRHPRAEDGSPS